MDVVKATLLILTSWLCASVFSGVYQRPRINGRVRRPTTDDVKPRVYAADDKEDILRGSDKDPTLGWRQTWNAATESLVYANANKWKGDPLRKLDVLLMQMWKYCARFCELMNLNLITNYYKFTLFSAKRWTKSLWEKRMRLPTTILNEYLNGY